MLIQGRLLAYEEAPSEAFAIWEEVFGGENPLLAEVFDEQTDFGVIAIVYEMEQEKKAVAAGRIYYDGRICELGAIAVRKEYQRKGYGDFMVRMLLSKAFTSGVKNVICTVPTEAISFFQGIGFRTMKEKTKQNGTKCKIMAINEQDIVRPCRK